MPVKSAFRVLQLLEHFDELRCGLTARQAADALRWPRSSTWGLMKTLAAAGYLAFDPRTRVYLPTERVAVLGLWAHTPLFGEGRLTRMMNELQRRTGGRVVLAAQAGNLVRYIHTIYSGRSKNWHFRRGAPIAILKTSVGRLFLSLRSDGEIRRIVFHLTAQGQGVAPPATIDDTLREIAAVRRVGYSVLGDRYGSGRGTISMLLPRPAVEGVQGGPLAIGITLATAEIAAREAELLALLRRAVAGYLAEPSSESPVELAVGVAVRQVNSRM